MESALRDVLGMAGFAIEAFGVFIILGGFAAASVAFADRLRRRDGSAYREYRRGLAKAIILGLEFLIAGDIIRTVVVDPTLTSVLVLAGIVLIRSFLSFTLQLEIEGRLPWSGAAEDSPGR